jgi:hypothetical protein
MGRHKGLKIPVKSLEMPFFLLKTAFLSQINNLKQAHSGCSVAIFSNFLVYKIYLRNRQGDAWYGSVLLHAIVREPCWSQK